MHLMEEKHLPALAQFHDRVKGFCGISWRTEHIRTLGFPCNPRKEDWEEPGVHHALLGALPAQGALAVPASAAALPAQPKLFTFLP